MMKTTTVCHQISPEALGQHTTLVRTPETWKFLQEESKRLWKIFKGL